MKIANGTEIHFELARDIAQLVVDKIRGGRMGIYANAAKVFEFDLKRATIRATDTGELQFFFHEAVPAKNTGALTHGIISSAEDRALIVFDVEHFDGLKGLKMQVGDEMLIRDFKMRVV